MPDVFISYSRPDSEVAERLNANLKRLGLDVFTDIDGITSGASLIDNIERYFKHAKVIIVLLSANTRQSRWVHKEVTSALDQGKAIIPVLLDSEGKQNWVWPLLADRHAIDLSLNRNDLQGVLNAVISALPDHPKLPMQRTTKRLFGGRIFWGPIIVLSATFGLLALFASRQEPGIMDFGASLPTSFIVVVFGWSAVCFVLGYLVARLLYRRAT